MDFLPNNSRLATDLKEASQSDAYFDKANAKIIASDYNLQVNAVLKQIQQLRKGSN